jgi:hypothetical protein
MQNFASVSYLFHFEAKPSAHLSVLCCCWLPVEGLSSLDLLLSSAAAMGRAGWTELSQVPHFKEVACFAILIFAKTFAKILTKIFVLFVRPAKTKVYFLENIPGNAKRKIFVSPYCKELADNATLRNLSENRKKKKQLAGHLSTADNSIGEEVQHLSMAYFVLAINT